MFWYVFLSLLIFLIGSYPAMALNIVTIEQSEYRQVLKTSAQKVLFPLCKEDKDLIDSMKSKLHELGGVGLAAPQVNVSKQIIAIYIPEDARLLRDNVETTYPMHVLINPSYNPITNTKISSDFEGCYSVSSKAGKVPRFNKIKITYYDESGQCHKKIEQGFYARVLQHEIDHLNGTLITDRLTPDCVQGTLEEMRILRRAELPQDQRILFDKLMLKKQKN